MAKADLHIHSTASDGKMTPDEVITAAKKLKLSAIALTDHDTIQGIQIAQKAAAAVELDVIPGVEITTVFNKRECHLLAYGFDLQDPDLNQLLSHHQNARIQRARWIIEQLGKKGLDLDIHEVLAEAGSRILGRPHIAAVLQNKGYVATFKEAFIRYLSDDKLGTIKSSYGAVEKVITTVKQAGGVTILAHPGRLYDEDELNGFVATGIDGMEVVHPSHSYDIQKKMAHFAQMHNLLPSGGSDFHGKTKNYYPRFGVVTISTKWVKKIQRLAERRNKISV